MAAHKQRGTWESRAKIYILAILSLIALSLAGCTLSGTQAAATPTVTVNLSPASISVKAGHTQQFTATVGGWAHTGVTWSASGGSITSGGMYTAPTSAGSFVVTATSAADNTRSASAAVTVSAAPVVSVTMSPASASILTGGTQQFTATVTGSSNTAVIWSATGGSVSSSGLYTAPSTAGTYAVTATGAADNTQSAAATVTVTAPTVSVSISPTSASLLTGGTQQFTATVSSSSNTAVTWSTTGGSVSSSGLYTAPSTAGTYTVKATSMADTTKSASATVTVSVPVQNAVPLTWTASTSNVSAYNVYRGTVSGGPYTKINSVLEAATSYVDNTVESGQTYYYIVTSVDSSGTESGFSNQATASVPAVLLALPLSATTYYVDNCVVRGSDSNNGTSPTTPWLTIGKVNGSSLSAGDTVLFRRTCTWREMLTVPSSGSAGSPITFGPYGSGAQPTISGGDIMSGFVSAGANVYDKTNLTTQPNICVINGSIGNLKGSKAAIAAPGDWLWGSNTLSVYATSDPSGTVVCGQRGKAIDLNSMNYITISGLTMTLGNTNSYDGGLEGHDLHDITVHNCTITHNAMRGIHFYNVNHVIVDSSVVTYNIDEGVFFGLTTTTPNTSTANTVSNNTVHDNGAGINVTSNTGSTMRHTSISIYGNTSYNNSSGIYVQFLDNSTIHDNTLYSNTRSGGENYGIGITSTNSTTFYNNLIHDNANDGIQLYGDNTAQYGASDGNSFYRNLIYDNAVSGFKSGIHVGGTPPGYVTNNLFSFNILYGNLNNFRVAYAGPGNKLYNNTLYGPTDRNVWFEHDNPGLDVQNNIFSDGTNANVDAKVVTTGLTTARNLYYASSIVPLVEYNSSNYTSTNITSFEPTALTSDPKFNNQTRADFTLQAGSPAIDAGINLGATHQFGLEPRTSFPWGTLNQNTQGSGWEIGAFVFVQRIPPAPPTLLSVTVQ